MLIVLEGIDGAGKTQLAVDLLSSPEGGYYMHFGVPASNPYEDYLRAIRARPADELAVIDRLHWGEAVYGPLHRGGSLLSRAEFASVEHELLLRSALLVFVDTPPGEAFRRLVRNNERPRPTDIAAESKAFGQIYRRSTVPRVRVDGCRPPSEVLNKVRDAAAAPEQVSW